MPPTLIAVRTHSTTYLPQHPLYQNQSKHHLAPMHPLRIAMPCRSAQRSRKSLTPMSEMTAIPHLALILMKVIMIQLILNHWLRQLQKRHKYDSANIVDRPSIATAICTVTSGTNTISLHLLAMSMGVVPRSIGIEISVNIKSVIKATRK